jgi:hypothetical protein
MRKPKLLSAGKCCIRSSKETLEIHYAKALRKDGGPIEDKYIVVLMQRKKVSELYPVLY